MQVVWFKRDLRLQDHAALAQAAASGPVLLLYLLEPALWREPDMSQRHYHFLLECLEDLQQQLLQQAGHQLVIQVGEAVEVLAAIHQTLGISALWSHQETGNNWTYQRDKRVLRWVQQQAIPWHEPAQNGVVRRLASRNGWAAHWRRRMQQPVVALPTSWESVSYPSMALPTASELGLGDDGCHLRQKGGRAPARRILRGFLNERGEDYSKAMSSPVTAYQSCSRLSPHLAFGTVSMREVYQAALSRQLELKEQPPATRGKWPVAVKSFHKRLCWHCHFIQKLEDEPTMEFANLHSAYDGLRENDFNQAYFEAWCEGRTGYPLIDACMRALRATGWLNFRMRAMLVSFASNHLWLHWRETALHLARLFTDYEPGIHYAQFQMQSGTTGINSIRIYNPIKQSIEQDPDGLFIKRWVEELADFPVDYIHTPWVIPDAMNGYPLPIVDEKLARGAAADRLYGLRQASSHGEEAKRIVRKHASRKRTATRRKKAKPAVADNQLAMDFGEAET